MNPNNMGFAPSAPEASAPPPPAYADIGRDPVVQAPYPGAGQAPYPGQQQQAQAPYPQGQAPYPGGQQQQGQAPYPQGQAPYPGQQQGQAPYPGQQQGQGPYPGQGQQPGYPPGMAGAPPPQQPYPGQQPGYPPGAQQPGYPPGAAPAPGMAPYPTQGQQHVVVMQVPVQHGKFDAGARFNQHSPASIPPAPPGCTPNSQQLSQSMGMGPGGLWPQQGTQQKKGGFFGGSGGGGMTFW